MARHRRSLLIAALALSVALALPLSASALLGGGLAGDECEADSDCMSRICEGDGRCAATTCGLTTAKGGVGPTMPAGYCSTAQVYNPNRVCTFGFGKCAKAECCDTLSCGVGVDQLAQKSYCAASFSFVPTRLCPNGVCSTNACCVQTTCDSAGGVAVDKRKTFCPSGTMFNNAGLCPAGEGKCGIDDCCIAETRTCGVAFADGLTCASPSVLVPTRMFDATAAVAGGCCETKTCGTTVPDAASFCSAIASTVFNSSPTCASGTCTVSDCCLQPKGYCDGTATKLPDGRCTCPLGKSYLIGTGCVCSPGTQLVNGACSLCPFGTFSALPTADQKCSPCPADAPYTTTPGADSADRCINYCDQALLTGSGACTNGGVCAPLSGDPAAGGSFSCTCPAGWMGYGATATNNCDAPSTLLRLRVLAASDVTLPSDFTLSVADAPGAAGDPAYARIASPAGSLACSIASKPTTPTVPTCTAGALSTVAAGGAAEARKFVQTKVKLSTNYGGDARYEIGWACSDGTQSTTAELAVVLPGPANTKGAMALVCTAIVGRPLLPAPVKLQLAADSIIPVPADAKTGPAQLTFVQGSRPACTLSVPASSSAPATEPQCAFNDQPFEGGKPGALGVANIDTERYSVAWSCGGVAQTTSPSGDAPTPNLPSPGQPVMVCVVRFATKTMQIKLTTYSSIATSIKINATQPGMNDACVATIPADKNAAQPTLACPSTYLASGVSTTLMTDADLTKYLVQFVCTSSTNAVASVYGVSVTTTSTRPGDATPTSCTVSVVPLPPLLKLKVVNTANAPLFQVFASQDSSDTCKASSASPAVTVDCPLGDGMSPGVKTALTPRGLDADKYTLTWGCTGVTVLNPVVQAQFSNAATIVLNANPNSYGNTITCTATVSLRGTPVLVRFDGPLGTDALLPQGAEVRVRQPQQAKACAAVRPYGVSFVAPTCDNEGLSYAAGTKTTLSTGNIPLTTTKVSWACATTANLATPVPVTLVSAGVAQLLMGGPTTNFNCKATLATKPPVLTLEMAVPAGAPPSAAWALSARQATQGRGCTVPVTATSASIPATAPTCLDTQPLLPARATTLTAPGLDSSRWAVDWTCNYADGPSLAQPLVLVDTTASSTSDLRNSKTVTLDKDANAGGWTVACKATLKARDEVLLLRASGDVPASGWTLTAKQPAQTSACAVSSSAAALGAAPTCGAGVVAFAAGTPVLLGTTGLPDSSRVSWACSAPDTKSIPVDQATTAAATVTPPAGKVTTCTATVTARTSATYFQLVGSSNSGITSLSAAQGSAPPMCQATAPGQTVACADAAPGTTTTLTVALTAAMAATNPSVRFSCTLGAGGAAVAVAKTSATTAVFTSPPAQESVVCTAVIPAKAPILTINSNVPVVLRAENQEEEVCTSSGPGTKLECDSGSAPGQLSAGLPTIISQTGMNAAGYYRWGCTSTEARLSRNGALTSPTASATITLPNDGGKPLTCWLLYTVDKPSFVRRLMRLR